MASLCTLISQTKRRASVIRAVPGLRTCAIYNYLSPPRRLGTPLHFPRKALSRLSALVNSLIY